MGEPPGSLWHSVEFTCLVLSNLGERSPKLNFATHIPSNKYEV